jgi:hypothetical protein
LPPYSPDLDFVEPVFAKVKNKLRKMRRRTIDGLWNAVAFAINDISSAECLTISAKPAMDELKSNLL